MDGVDGGWMDGLVFVVSGNPEKEFKIGEI